MEIPEISLDSKGPAGPAPACWTKRSTRSTTITLDSPILLCSRHPTRAHVLSASLCDTAVTPRGWLSQSASFVCSQLTATRVGASGAAPQQSSASWQQLGRPCPPRNTQLLKAPGTQCGELRSGYSPCCACAQLSRSLASHAALAGGHRQTLARAWRRALCRAPRPRRTASPTR